MLMKFDELLDNFYKAEKELSEYMVNEVKDILNHNGGSCEFLEKDSFVSINSTDNSEYEEIDLVLSLWLDNEEIYVTTIYSQVGFTDLTINEQIAIRGELKNLVSF